MKYSDEAIFCVKYLKDCGFLSGDNLAEIAALVDDFDVEFKFVKIDRGYFHDLAVHLRALWPPGEKDEKHPWRDSVDNLKERLETMWVARNLKEYPIETCLSVARRYLAQFETSTKYMQTLKYFILKQGKIIEKDGKIKYIQQSRFADMLENNPYEVQDEWNEAFESSSTIEQGELI